MISDKDLESAVSAGIISADVANALKSHASGLRATPVADEENFRLVSSFNDIFVSLAGILFLFGVGWLVGSISPAFGGLAVAATAWGLAEFFTLKRRMALPSIIFFLAFIWSIMGAMSSFLDAESGLFAWRYAGDFPTEFPGRSAIVYLITAAASYGYWKRFMVPISIAGGTAALAALITMTAIWVSPELGQWLLVLMLILGLCVFAFAMYWDRQDRDRTTRKSDVAFWLHLLASPLIVHPIFALTGINWIGGDMGEGSATMLAVLAVGIYLILGLVAVIIDRRALLVSALAYVIAALIFLITRIGVTSSSMALAIILIGSALLILSAFWQNLRGWLFRFLPEGWKPHLPPVQL